MTSPDAAVVRHRRLLIAAGVLSSVAFMAIAVGRLHLDDIRGALAQARPWPWLPLAVVAYLVGHLVRGLRCRALVSREARLSVPSATNVVVLGYAVNNILPARLGELARAAMLAEKTGLPFAQSLSVTFSERLLDGLVLLLLLVLGAFRFGHARWIHDSARLGAVVFGSATAGVLLAVVAPSALLGAASRASFRFGPRVHGRVVSFVRHASRGLSYFGRPFDAIRALSLSVAVWLLEGTMFLLLLPVLGLEPSPSVALLALSVTNLGILIPSSPGFVGPFHFFCMKALTSVGVTEAVAFSYAALAHLTFFIPITAWGTAVLAGWGVSASALASRARSAQPLELTDELMAEEHLPRISPAAPAPTPFFVALAAALTPTSIEGLSDEEHRRVNVDAATFLQSQIDALPGRLAFLFSAGMGTFRFVTRLRYARGFCDLEPATSRRWCELWAFGRIGLARQLFRAPRSLALVAFYDHELVRQRLSPPRRRPLELVPVA